METTYCTRWHFCCECSHFAAGLSARRRNEERREGDDPNNRIHHLQNDQNEPTMGPVRGNFILAGAEREERQDGYLTDLIPKNRACED